MLVPSFIMYVRCTTERAKKSSEKLAGYFGSKIVATHVLSTEKYHDFFIFLTTDDGQNKRPKFKIRDERTMQPPGGPSHTYAIRLHVRT